MSRTTETSSPRRTIPARVVALAAALCLAAGAARAGDAALPDSAAAAATDSAAVVFATVPYAPGERLVFSIDYGPVNAGEASLEVVEAVDSGGHPCYVVESRARSNRFFSAFYMVRDKVVSHIDRRHLFSRYFAKRLREGDYRKNLAIRFDQGAGKAYYADGRELDVPPGVHDILSAFYYVRTLDLAAGDTTSVVTHTSRKNYPLEVIVHGRETVTVPAGTFDCFVVEPVIQGEGLFQFEGRLTIWMTADERRMPVLMKTKVKVGSIDASLKEYVLGGGAGGKP